MKSFIQELAKFVEDLKFLKSDDSSVQDYTNWAVLTAAMLVKANDWKYESEWRLIRWKHLDLTEFDHGEFRRRERFHLGPGAHTNPQHNDELSVKIRNFYNWEDKRASTVSIGPKIVNGFLEIENWLKSVGCKGIEVRCSRAPLR